MRNLFHDRNLKRFRDSIALLDLISKTWAKYLLFGTTACALVVRHILDKRHRRNFEAVKHLNAFHYINIAESLRSGHNDSSSEVKLLAKCELNIASSWWEIDNEVV